MNNYRNVIILLMALVIFSCAGTDKSKDTNKELKTITTASGLKYIDLVEGTGNAALNGQTLLVHYVGTLDNGVEFDNSRERNEPITVRLGAGKVIKGWDEGLLGMKVGGKRKLIIPPDLGYGARRSGPIPPNSTLYFEVEVLEIK